MSKEIYISSTPHETRLAIVEKDELTEIYYERENEYTLAGSIYNGRVTRVLPGMQSSFVDIGLERDAFLYITDFMEESGDAADFETEETKGSRSGRRPERSGRPRGEQPSRETRPEPHSEESALGTASEEGSATSTGDSGLGEGAPGADGSRRWRGRRGRRRGFSGTQTDDSSAEQNEASGAKPEHMPAPAPQNGRESHTDRGGHRGERGPRRDNGRDRGRNERGDRHEQVRDRFAPRSARHVEDEGVDVQATAEPFILPGESLSKYRGRSDEGGTEREGQQGALPSPGNVITPKPSTEVVLTGWDGGAVLPGETIRPRAGAGAVRDEAQRGNSDRQRFDRGPRREGRPSRDSHRQSFHPAIQTDPAEAVLPAVTSQHEAEPSAVLMTDDAPEFEVQETEQRLEAEHLLHAEEVYEAQTDQAPPATESTPLDHAAAAAHEAVEEFQEFHETTTEYEPGEDAAASFRVDSAGVSEFRLGNVAEDEIAPADQHAFTAVQPTGEMISEVSDSANHENPTAPIKHELAVQSVHLAEAETVATPLEKDSVQADSNTFAPGEGALEEELLDDEDSELPRVHALHEDMEEETLESAADLGSMLRDMSIDQLTQGEPAETEHDEDFDLDEEMEEDELEAGEGDFEPDEESVEDGDSEGSSEDETFEESAAGDLAESNGETRPREISPTPRREFRRGGRDRNADRGHRPRTNGRPGRSGRHSMQATDLPAISDLLKPGQEVLVQIAKEPIAKKGARITSHIALPGRFLVFMPTVNHTGVSRKIESDSERRRLKEILLSERGEASGGFIVRTAAAGANEEELRSDLRFLLNLWADIKARSESSKSPALIYHDLNLVERVLRDQVTDNFSAIWVDTEDAYERVLRFLQRFQPGLIRRVKLYTKETPLFEQFGITEEINKALRAKVWLKSGGSIVINQTEALVAIDINTGKYVGKTARLEDTILKTNLDAIPEIVRQIRLRDLGGIIIIDFIDMDERKNRTKVMAALEEELKKDRAPSKVLQFNDFGLVAITRKRVKQSLERTLSITCNVCVGTGMVKSPVTVCNEIFIELRKMHKHLEKGDIMLRVNPEVVKQLKTNGGKWLQEMEDLSGKTILVKSDPTLHPEQFDIH